MFIIVEGPDGAGKSTLVQELAMHLWHADRGTVLINPKRSPRQHVLVEYKLRLDFYQPRKGIDLILDRCWYSDDVYGPRRRGAGLEAGVRTELEVWADGLGAVVALLDQPDELLRTRLLVRGDEDVEPDDVAIYAALYRSQSEAWGLETLVNPNPAELIERAAKREDTARALRRK
jgi:ABC-type cobalamin/Fe3+-siderophores transport system ATPase subunit